MSDQNRNVQLGCGTLIAIAIIVMIFSGGRNDSATRKEIRELNQKIDRLEKKIDALTAAQTSTAPAPARR
jgi:outer membrane murein-binding lipoprotein Lpp